MNDPTLSRGIKAKKPLQGVKVLDLTTFLSGPFATMLLGGLGAEVIKVEEPGYGDPARLLSLPFIGANGASFEKKSEQDETLAMLKRGRNKKSITLNLRSDKGREILHEMVKKVDVFAENFATGVVERMGCGYDILHGMNSKLIYCSLSGFGRTGPYKDFVAFDPSVQAMSGLMATTGFPDGVPLRAGPSFGDMVPGLYAVIGILAALHSREKTGEGQYIDVSMLDSLFSLVYMEPQEVYQLFGFPLRAGNTMYRTAPFNLYRTKDGYIVIVVPTEEQWKTLLKIMGKPELDRDPKFSKIFDRIRNHDELDPIVEEWTSTKTTSETMEMLTRERVPCGEVVDSLERLLSDPQLLSREMIVDLEHPLLGKLNGIRAPGIPIKFSETPVRFDQTAPVLGQHNEEIYSLLLGYTGERIAKLKEEKVI